MVVSPQSYSKIYLCLGYETLHTQLFLIPYGHIRDCVHEVNSMNLLN